MRSSKRIGSSRGLVLALAAGGLALAAPGAFAAPTVSGADTDVWNVANPTPVYTITASSRRARVFWQIPGFASGDGRSPVQLDLRQIPDGSFRLVAVEFTDRSVDLTPTQRSFRVDRTPPVVTIRRPVAGEQIGQGARVLADYACDGAVTCAGPVASGATLLTKTVGASPFAVRATDDAGNETVASADYVVNPSAAAAALARSRLVQTVNARMLRPRAGVVVTSRRPVLRWRGRAGARLYNVQLFRLRGDTAVKVLSAFPRRSRLRVPPKKIVFGARYLWRVWPYLSGGYPKRPLGLSYFEVREPRAK